MHKEILSYFMALLMALLKKDPGSQAKDRKGAKRKRDGKSKLCPF